MDIHWFPGHMAKAKREISEIIRMVDLVLEVRDARIPESSRNPDVHRLTERTARIILLNKADLADPALTAKWQGWMEANLHARAFAVDARSGAGFDRLRGVLAGEGRKLQASLKERGRLPRSLRLVVMGIPNVGKSTVLNRLAGRKAARTGDIPGVTRGKQWIRLPEQLELLDSPGLLPPKLNDPRAGVHLAFIGTIPEDLVPLEDLASELLLRLAPAYSDGLIGRYGENDLNADDLLGRIAGKKGCLVGGGRPDYIRAARMILDDFRAGRLGRITLETPPSEPQ